MSSRKGGRRRSLGLARGSNFVVVRELGDGDVLGSNGGGTVLGFRVHWRGEEMRMKVALALEDVWG